MNHERALQPKLVMENEDILAILEAADEIIGRAGRAMLTKLLKGSKDKKLLSLELDRVRRYGHYSCLTLEQIAARVDWMIENDFLSIEYQGDMPLLYFTDRGWIVEREQQGSRLLQEWSQWLEEGRSAGELDMLYLKDRNRGMILLFLEKVARSRDKRFIPYLEQWKLVDYRKIREAIDQVVRYLEQPEEFAGEALQLEGAPRDWEADWKNALDSKAEDERLKCWDCGNRFIWTVKEQGHYRLQGWEPPKRCPACREKKWLRRNGIMDDEF
ncbi:MAG: hypothetical protein K0R57_435 [Paenibacillaceae bacterium]|jgi:hypothetical protein|nr:hypothetical protein [Paenibacillaceae bacterium]